MENRNPAPTPFDSRRFGVVSVAGRRPANEDAWTGPATPTGAVACYVVADGVGGQERGAQAANTAAAVVARAFDERRAAGDDPPAALRAAVAAANEEVYRLARSLGVERMGCTLVAAAVGGGRLDVAHVGDARAWLLRDGQLYRLTRDHTWVQEQMDRGTITPADAARHELRHIVTRVLGNDSTLEVTLSRPAAFGPGDRLLLSTDGLHDVLDEARLTYLLGAGAPPETARALVEAALAAGSEDNVTALVVESAPAAAPPTADRRPPPEALPAGIRIAAASPAAAAPPEPITVQGKRRPIGPPAVARPRRRTAAGPALVGALAVLLILIGLGIVAPRLLRSADVPDAMPTAAVPAYPAATVSGYPATTHPVATSTAAPAGYPDPTATAAASGAMCILPPGGTFLYSNEKAAVAGQCYWADHVLQGQVLLLEGRQPIITRPDCGEYEFQQVRSVTPPDMVGWVLASHIGPCPEEQ